MLTPSTPPSSCRVPVRSLTIFNRFLHLARGQEFIRVGYYVNNEYEDEEMRENPPAQPQTDK